MDTNLIMYDIDNFLEKYTRFMTKNIYISTVMYRSFLNQYDYLYDELSKNSILFRENNKYKKIMNIKNNKDKLLRLHNKKYLKKATLEYYEFFQEMGYNKTLDNSKKAIILSDEDKLLVVDKKKKEELISGKVKYLLKYSKISKDDILILNKENNSKLNDELIKQNLDIKCVTIANYQEKILGDVKTINHNKKYLVLSSYLMDYLFPKKEEFIKLYQAFPNNIYLNKDYLDFETFKDYHNYIYRKVYLTSNLSLEKFNQKEIEKRTSYLRTIKNEIMENRESIDIANFLYLNCIDYEYNNNLFIIENNDIKTYISLKKISKDLDVIYLDTNTSVENNHLETLAYQLIKRRYPLEKRSDDTIFNRLKDTTLNSYFKEFINNYLIPLIDYYDKFNSFIDINLNDEQIEVLKNIYKYYQEYLNNNKLITDNTSRELLENNVNKYKYVIINGDIEINLNTNYLKIIDNYKEELLLKENIKLLYDYRNYLLENSKFPIKDVYINEGEITMLTNKFLKENLQQINNNETNLNKKIKVYLYDDSNRLQINKNISKLCLEIIKNNLDILIGVDNSKQLDNIVLKNYFYKYTTTSLITSSKKIVCCQEITNIKNLYNSILLPFLIKDKFHDNLLEENNSYNIKVMIYVTLNRCRDNLIILCPSSKRNLIEKTLENITNVCYVE